MAAEVLLFSLTNGKPVTPEGMKELIERADGDKERRAMERLTAVRAVVAELGPATDVATETERETGV